MTLRLLSFLLMMLLGHTASAQEVLTTRLAYGKHPVGFRIVRAVDAGRSYLPSRDYFGEPTRFARGRPMQIAMWYPASGGKRGHKLRYGDYLGYSASDTDFSKTSSADRTLERDAYLAGTPEPGRDAMRVLLDMPIAAKLDATMAAGDWPVVLYAPPQDTAFFDNSVLCEYLASKGYLVLSVTAKGEYTRLQSPTVRSLHVQADDLAFLMQFARRHSRSERIGTIGFSRGGLANLLFAVKNRDVAATVSLDGSVFSDGWLRDVAASPYFVPEEIESPLLMITKNLANPQVNPATFYDAAIHADRSLIRFDHDVHAYFSSWALLEDVTATRSRPDVDRYLDAYAEMVDYVGEFLDAALKSAAPMQAHAHPRFAHEVRSEQALRTMDPADIQFWISEKGIDYVHRVIEDLLRRDRGYLETVRWRDLRAAAERELAGGNRGDALKILLLADRVAPDWYPINEMIAERYQDAGDIVRARQYYAKALRDNPRSETSRRGLAELGVRSPALAESVPATQYPRYIGVYGKGERGEKSIVLRDGALYIGSSNWDAPVRLLAYEQERFIVESDDPKANMQVLFEFDERGNVKGLRTRGMNSGKVGELLLRAQAP